MSLNTPIIRRTATPRYPKQHSSFITEGISCKVKGINSYRTRNNSSASWNSELVRRIICNEVYIGSLVSRKEYHPRVRERKRVEESERLRFENAHKPIVSKDIF